ncbi:MAG: roadblock/LC7 domain-containing protein [Anaerolineales bacterium]|nr:roadblock/LC7 domain-containing protein [Anaerolineales bacterium]
MNERSYGSGADSVQQLEEVLEQMTDNGDFKAIVLASDEGLPLAAVPSPYDSDTTAAMVALLQRVSREARDQLDMAKVDEVTISDCERIRLVCRYLEVDGDLLILAVMVPPNAYYRRVTNRAVRRIKDILCPN